MLIFKLTTIYTALKIVSHLIILSVILSQNMIWSQLDLSTIKYLSDDDYKAEEFLKHIATGIPKAASAKAITQKPVFITINHIVPTILPYLSALSSVGDIAMIIPKGDNPNPEVHLDLKDAYGDKYKMVVLEKGKEKEYKCAIMRKCPQRQEALAELTRLGIKFLESPEDVRAILAEIQRQYPERPIIIIDIGGYFVNALKISTQVLSRDRINLVGIVEDTENGHQKYEEVLRQGQKQNTIPIYSVARSELKKTEDYCVGKSIVEATDTLFRIKKHTIPERMQTVGVMGYGKIGSSIADHLRRKNIHVFVSEVIPLRAQLALANDHNVVFDSVHPENGYKELFKRTNIIFGATGQKALTLEDLKDWLRYQDVIYLSSCTSAVDEYAFDPFKLGDDSDFEPYRKDDQVLEFTVDPSSFYDDAASSAKVKQKKVIFFRGGNAVNFCFGGVNGPYIYSVQAALLTAASKLFQHTTQQTVSRDVSSTAPLRSPLLIERHRRQAVGGASRLQPLTPLQTPISTTSMTLVTTNAPLAIMNLEPADETNISKIFLWYFTKQAEE